MKPRSNARIADKISNMVKKIGIVISIISVAVFITVPIVGCSSEQSNLKIIDHKITVQNFGGDTVQGLAVVSGQAQNTGTTTIPMASITVEFYDKDSKFLNSASTIFENLKPNATWYFSAQFAGPDAWKTSTYKVINSTK